MGSKLIVLAAATLALAGCVRQSPMDNATVDSFAIPNGVTEYTDKAGCLYLIASYGQGVAITPAVYQPQTCKENHVG